MVGGISRTAQYKGFRFDIGGHRFFTKIDRSQALWHELLGDEFISVPRLSRIYYNGTFFDYPLKAGNALRGLGLVNALLIVLSYVKWHYRPYPVEENFEQWVTNRFGRRLYEIFFKTYTEKVWGIPCTEIRAEWAAQRIQGLSLAQGHPQRHVAQQALDGHQIADQRVPVSAARAGPDVGDAAAIACRDAATRCCSSHQRHRQSRRSGGRVIAVSRRDTGWRAPLRGRSRHLDDAACARWCAPRSGGAGTRCDRAAEGLRYRDFLVGRADARTATTCFPTTGSTSTRRA